MLITPLVKNVILDYRTDKRVSEDLRIKGSIVLCLFWYATYYTGRKLIIKKIIFRVSPNLCDTFVSLIEVLKNPSISWTLTGKNQVYVHQPISENVIHTHRTDNRVPWVQRIKGSSVLYLFWHEKSNTGRQLSITKNKIKIDFKTFWTTN